MKSARLLGLVSLTLLAGCSDGPTALVPGAPRLSLADGGGAIYSDAQNDYQPSLLRARDGTLMIVFERLAARTNLGDLYLSTSADGGLTWSAPALIVGTKLNERHPSLVQLPSGEFALFHLVDEGRGVYRIHRATSPDGRAWTRRGAIGLGWSTGGELNPSVIVEAGGALTMTYQRSGVGYIARSLDGGATWDGRRTSISGGGSGMLPRVAKRESDGLYVVTYQLAEAPGSYRLNVLSKSSADPYAWSSAPVAIAEGTNAHDSQPIVLEDGRFLVMFIAQGSDAAFNVLYRTGTGAAWNPPVAVTADANVGDVEPHPILGSTPGHLILSWGRERVAGTNEFDIWVNRDVAVQ